MTEHTTVRNELHLIDAILAGDIQLYHELIRPYERSVYLMALSFMNNEADAEDVAQEAFLKALEKLSQFRAESKFSTWLITITLNEAKSRLRRETKVRIESLDGDDGHGAISPALLTDWREVPSKALERQEIRAVLQQAVSDLPDIYRETFILRDVEELSVSETAEALNITETNVKVRLHRARIMLQRKLAPQLKQVSPERRWLSWL